MKLARRVWERRPGKFVVVFAWTGPDCGDGLALVFFAELACVCCGTASTGASFPAIAFP